MERIVVERKSIKKVEMEEEEEEGAKWVAHYCSDHQILLVGEGDFSFSLSLAKSFASASNIVATSLDSYDEVTEKYKHAKSNLDELQYLGACLLHGVDATKMKHHPNLETRRFDRVIFNFPHAGFYGKEDNKLLIQLHKDLVLGFFRNASCMLRADGEIHLSHKTTIPFSDWNIKKLATQSFLTWIECADFNKEDYPFYNNKRGHRNRCDEPFPLGECCTFKFIYNPKAMRNHKKRNGMVVSKQQTTLPLQVTFQQESKDAVNYLPSSVHLNYYPQASHIPRMNEAVPSMFGLTNRHTPIAESHLSNMAEVHGRGAPSAGYSTPLGMNIGPHRSLHPSYPLQPWTSSTNVGYSQQGHVRTMDPFPLSFGARNEDCHVYGGSSYSFQEALGRTTAQRGSYSCDGVRSDFGSRIAEMPARTVNGDMYCGCSNYLQGGGRTTQRASYNFDRGRTDLERRLIAKRSIAENSKTAMPYSGSCCR